MHDLSKEFAAKLAVMLDASLIHYQYYELWCDEMIEQMEQPPDWVLQLTSTEYLPEARNIVYRYAFAEPIADFCYSDFYLACLYVKYCRKHISWGTFLLSAGQYSDGNDCCKDCEYFYDLLTRLEQSEYAEQVAAQQAKQVYALLSPLIQEADGIFESFLPYFRAYCKTKNTPDC